MSDQKQPQVLRPYQVFDRPMPVALDHDAVPAFGVGTSEFSPPDGTDSTAAAPVVPAVIPPTDDGPITPNSRCWRCSDDLGRVYLAGEEPICDTCFPLAVVENQQRLAAQTPVTDLVAFPVGEDSETHVVVSDDTADATVVKEPDGNSLGSPEPLQIEKLEGKIPSKP